MNRPPWQQGLGLLILTALLGGCAAFGPDRTPAARITPEQLALADKSTPTPGEGWWHALQDPRLDLLVDTALKNAPSVQLADARFAEAMSLAGYVKGNDGPHLKATASMERQQYSRNSLLGPMLAAPGGPGLYQTEYMLTAGASWSLDFFGKHAAELDAALGSARASEMESRQARLLLTQAVIAQYSALQRARDLRQINDARLRLSQTRVSLMKARVTAGLLSADSLHQVELQMAGLRSRNAAIDADMQRARHALAALTGQAPGALDTLSPAAVAPAPALDNVRLGANLLGQRPDIQAAQARVEAMSSGVKAARAEFYPDVSLTAFIGLDALESDQVFKRNSRMMGITPAISLPLFYSGQLQANLSRQQDRYDQAVAAYNQTLLDAVRDTADALSAQQQAQSQWREARAAQDAARKSADAMTARIRAGLASKLNALDAEDTVLAQQASRIEAETATRLAWAALNTALGGAALPAPAAR